MFKFLFTAVLLIFSANSAADKIPAYSDGEILQILLNVNSGEIASSKIAQRQAQRRDVKDFATMMVNEHSMNNSQTQRLAVKYNIRLQPSSMSRDLNEVGSSFGRDLLTKRGYDFDKSYMDRQVMMHETALANLNSKLIPVAKTVAVKDHLEATREAVILHLEEARSLLGQL